MADPYDFENDDYEESTTPNFEPSFMENFERTDVLSPVGCFGESDDEEFTGFTAAEYAAVRRNKPECSNVATFHHRNDEERYAYCIKS